MLYDLIKWQAVSENVGGKAKVVLKIMSLKVNLFSVETSTYK
jgi:ribosome-associated protein YbcJ (S4-like RNA binding protein)